MRSTLLLLALAISALGLSSGCSPSGDAEKPDASTSGPPPRGWASDSQPSTVDPLPPVAADRSGTSDAATATPQPPAAAPAADPTLKPLDAGVSPKRPETTEASPPADAFSSAAGNPSPWAPAVPPESPPTLHNPLRDAVPADDTSNPMRRPAAPLPDSVGQSPPPPGVASPAGLPGPTGPDASNGRDGAQPSSQMEGPATSGRPPPSGPLAPSGPPVPSALPAPLLPPASSSSSAHATPAATTEEPFDPIKENGPIFEGWSKPKLALVITGRTDGYIEPCGCAGLEKMKGGLARRHTMIRSLADERGWPVVVVDVGGLIKGYGPQTEIKFQCTVDAMKTIGYSAIGFGANDLVLPVPELVSATAGTGPFVSANVGLFGFEAGVNARTQIVERNGLKTGVTAVLGKKYQDELKARGTNSDEMELASPEEAIAQALPKLRKTCNLLVLLAYATRDESIALAQKFPDFQLVVTSDGSPEPPKEPVQIPGTKSLLIEVGEKGANAVVIGLYDDPKKPLRYQRVPLDSRFAASKDMYRVMVGYQEELQRRGLDGLGVRAVSHPQAEVNGPFVGSEKCKACHEESYRIWKKSGHAKAWETLVKNDPPRNFDPECISCHVVGWHPTKYFPYKTGFLSEKKTPEMVKVGCESCHGPCGNHCKAEDGSDLDYQEKQYLAVRVTKEESQNNLDKMCQTCHDLDNSPEFNFETYWPKVEHYENEDEEDAGSGQ